ncbi:MAG: hypothetical protein GY937_00265 [bacterium]|nr:hypothetical protein [bacterium]
MANEQVMESLEPEDSLRRQPRDAIRRGGPELRARITDHLYEMLTRDAATRRIPMAELARRILTEHYERTQHDENRLLGEVAALRAELADAAARGCAERNMLFTLLNLMYKGLLLRMERVPEGELEARAEAADLGHQKLRDALSGQLSACVLEDLVDVLDRTPAVGIPSGEPKAS